MSAVPSRTIELESMAESDLDEVLAIEQAVYTHPWTRGNFIDSLQAGYTCRTRREAGMLIGYFVLFCAAGEAHLLNLSVAAAGHRRGHGSALLGEILRLAAAAKAERVFLEVRPSNAPGLALYKRFGFERIGLRRDYYPAEKGREDALVLARAP
jgi:ribosomal-protein-alanine N-acetyltransferase